MLKMLKLGKKWRLHLTTAEEDKNASMGRDLLNLYLQHKLILIDEMAKEYATSVRVSDYEAWQYLDDAMKFAKERAHAQIAEQIAKIEIENKLGEYLILHKVETVKRPDIQATEYRHKIRIFKNKLIIHTVGRL